MDEAAKKNIYKKMILHVLGDDPIPIDSSKCMIQPYNTNEYMGNWITDDNNYEDDMAH